MSGAFAGENAEAWSGKDRANENFPVGSILIRRDLRRHVHAFYAFARNADDIADHPQLPPEEKIQRLDIMEAVLTGARESGSPTATALRTSLVATNVTATHARELLVAFRQDATKKRYASWTELMEYCRYSAAPVGRYVLELHGEKHVTWRASDALCASLQVLNHLQDCANDLRTLDRCYLPQDWLREAKSSTEEVAAARTSPGLRRAFAMILRENNKLNAIAADLPKLVDNRRLRIETAVITALARRLQARLNHNDPLAMRVKLRATDVASAILSALPRLA